MMPLTLLKRAHASVRLLYSVGKREGSPFIRMDFIYGVYVKSVMSHVLLILFAGFKCVLES